MSPDLLSDEQLTALLRTLDPADREVDPRGPAARSVLARVLADPGGVRRQPAPRRRRRRLVVGAVAAAVATVGAVVALPAVTGGDAAFATWRRVPEGLSAAASAEAAEQCRGAQRDGPGTAFDDQLATATVAVAERRGAWTTVLLAGDDGFAALCVTDESTAVFKDWIGSIGTPTTVPAPGPRDVLATDLGTGELDAGVLSLAAGRVGSEVAGVAYVPAGGRPVVATVSAGHFALWLPGGAFDDASTAGVVVTVTFRDGTSAVRTLSLPR